MTKVKRPSLFSLFTQKSDPVGTSAANQASNGTSDTVDQSNGNEDDQNLFQEYSYLIVCCGITKDFATVSHELRKRGFLVEACSNGSHANSNSNSANNSSHDKETVQKSQETQKSNYYDLLVSMSPKLVIKLAIHSNLPIKRFQDYSYSQKLVLLEHAINILKKTKPISAKSVWLSSDKDFVNLIHNEEDSKKQNLLNYYYGSKIAIYFGWLKYYTHELRVPALLGTVLFIHQTIVGTIDTIFMPIFCIFISLWGTYLLEFAKRRMSEMAFEWKVSGVEDEELDEELAKAASKESSSTMMYKVLSICATISLMMIMIQLMLFYIHEQQDAAHNYGTNSWMQYYPTVIYSVLPTIATTVFEPIATMLDKFEEWPTKAEEENSHIIKIFFLQFINRYCALLYTAFWLKDMVTLRYLLISLLTLQALLGNLWEYFGAYIIAFGKKLFKKNGLTGARSSSNSPTRSQSSATGTLTTDVDDKFKTLDDNYDADASINVLEKLLAEEIGKPTYDINDDYLELVLQFGYVIMFAVVLPVAPLAALVNNIFEYWVDIHKIGICRKPTHTRRSNMGAWLWCLEFISFISVLTNCYLVTMVSTHVDILIPTSFHKFLATEEGKIVVMLLIEHVLMAIKVVMAVLIDDVPRKVSEALAYERVRNKQLEAKKRMMNFTNDVQSSVYGTDRSNNHPFSPVPLSASTSISRVSKRGSNSDLRISTLKANAGTSSAVDDTRSTTSKQSSRVNLLDKGNTLAMAHLSPEMLKPTINYPLDDKNKSDVTTDDRTELEISVSKLEKQCDTQFGFDPMNMMLLVATPLLLQYFHLSPYLYFPISALCFGYLKAQKDRADRKAAIGIISDPAIMKLVIEEMPSWVSDAEFQRVEWINNILQKLWGNLATAVEVEVMKSIQPILDKHTPPFLTMLKLKRISLGSISPKIVGIRVFHTSESVVRIDVEFRWAGDPLVSLKVGTLPLPIPIEVSKLRVSGKVRIELLEMTHQLPCFKAISVTCMEKPFVDFSLKVASLDLMNIGAAEYNIMRIVRNIIHSIVSNIALYPKKIIVPMNKGVDVDALATLTPIGILYITFIRGKDLKQVNLFGQSDPFVEVKSVDQMVKTKTKYGTINPEWNERVNVLVYDKDSQIVDLTVYDSDISRMNTLLGRSTVKLSSVPPNVKTNKTLLLADVDTGSIEVLLEYIPISAAGSSTKNALTEEDDVLFTLTKEALTDEMLLHDEETELLLEANTDDPSSNGDGRGGRAMLSRGALDMISTPTRGKSGNAEGVVTISQIRLRNLKGSTTLSALLEGKTSFRPFVTFTIGRKVKATKSLKGGINHNFPETFSFLISGDPREQRISVKIFDMQKIFAHRLIGTVIVLLENLVDHFGPLEKEYMIEGSTAESYVGFKLQWSSY